MKLIKLTQGKFAKVDDEDYDYLNQFKWYAYKSKYDKTYYAKRNITISKNKYGSIVMHRVILGLTDPKIKGDHINHDGLDNQKYNLREATHRQNCQNKSSAKNSTSRYLGVSYFIRERKYKTTLGIIKTCIYTPRYLSGISINGKKINLGQFINEIDAALAYNKAAIKYFGEFANLNII